MVLRLNVDSFDISTNIVQEAAMFRFHVILEELSVFLSDKIRPARDLQSGVKFNHPRNSECKVPRHELPSNLNDFLCLIKMGFFQLMLTNHEPPLIEDAGMHGFY